MSSLAFALLAELNDEALDALAERLIPRLIYRLSVDLTRPASGEALLTCQQAAERATLHVETIRRAVRSGALRAGRAGRSPRIAAADLEEWLGGGEHRHTKSQQPIRRPSGAGHPLADALANIQQRSPRVR